MNEPTLTDAQHPDPKARIPRDVLVAEDALIIALDIEDTLTQIGVETVRIVTTVEHALSEIAARAPDFAIVDYNLGDASSEPVMEELLRRAIPLVIATGDSFSPDDVEQLGPIEVLYKPFSRDDITDAVLRIANG